MGGWEGRGLARGGGSGDLLYVLLMGNSKLGPIGGCVLLRRDQNVKCCLGSMPETRAFRSISAVLQSGGLMSPAQLGCREGSTGVFGECLGVRAVLDFEEGDWAGVEGGGFGRATARVGEMVRRR